ncbi:hypothetical protein [Plantactinospora sp. WMMB782]|uniref:hypothetical protein n=1 Tax=Plantactinospora sp. WMMB782 TaxID=3404121 RepID=UPI003B9378CB
MDTKESAVDVGPPLPALRPRARFTPTVLALAAGGAAVGLAINLALAIDAPLGTSSWGRTLLLLVATAIAAAVGALATRSLIVTQDLARRTTIGLERAANTLAAAFGEVPKQGPRPQNARPQPDAIALHERLDSFGLQLDALRRSGNRTAWWTFVLGAVLGVLTQIMLG